MNGVDIRTVAEIMGHRNISQTMKYTHFLDDHKLDWLCMKLSNLDGHMSKACIE